MAGSVVESAAAGYQPERRVIGRAVNGFRREIGFGVLAYPGDAKNGGDPVGERHVDAVPGTEGAQAEEDGRPVITVEVTFDNRRTDLARRRRVLVPRRGVRRGEERRHL